MCKLVFNWPISDHFWDYPNNYITDCLITSLLHVWLNDEDPLMANLQLNKNFYILLSSSVGIIIRKQIHANTNFLQGFKAWFFFFHYYFTRQNTIVFIADPWVCHLSIGGLWMSMVAARTLLSAIFGLSDNKLISMLHWIHSTASTLGQRNILRRVSIAYKSKFGWTLSRQLGYFVFRLCQLWLCMGGAGDRVVDCQLTQLL